MNHILTEKNMETMTAVCAVDGPVSIRSKGTGRFQCAVKKREIRKAYSERHPDVIRRNRNAGRSTHHLTSFDESTMTGECPVCGTVGVVVKGRRRKDGVPGVMCRNRARQLWPNAHEESPQERCSTCRRVYLDANGDCPHCTDEQHTNLNLGFAVLREQHAENEWLNDMYDGELQFAGRLTDDARSIEGDTVSNPALKVIGAGVPAGMSASKYIDQWWAANAHLV